MEAARKRAAEQAKIDELVAQAKEFDRQWRINAQKVVDAHPELRYEDSLYSRAIRKMLNSNQLYSRRVNGFELAYKAIRTQPPSPGRMLPATEVESLLDNLKTDLKK